MIRRQMSLPGVWQLKVTLQESRPPIWRTILVRGNTTLYQLHYVLQDVMGWTNSHLHLFYVGDTSYGDPDPELEMEVRNERKVRLSQIAGKPKAGFVYEYDMGDSWTHDIVVEKILSPAEDMRYAVCLDGARACPPEDCGGIGGYENLLEILRDPRHEEHNSMLKWLGRPFDPEEFDAEAVNRTLSPRLTVRFP